MFFFRADNSGRPGELLVRLKEVLSSVCENFFRFQKFKIGPVCPSAACPGSNPDGSKCKRSCSGQSDGSSQTCSRRPFVIDFNPEVQRPIYCHFKSIDDHEDVKIWSLVSDSHNVSASLLSVT